MDDDGIKPVTNQGFFTYVFKLSKFKQEDLMNILQYAILSIAPVMLFIYFTKKYFKVGGLTKMFLKQLVGALPYIGFVIIFKNIVNDNVILLTTISIISLIWFCIYHLFILKNK